MTENMALTLFGSDPDQALYRSLWIYLKDCGYDDRDMHNAEDFRGFYDYGGYAPTLIRLDPIANPDSIPFLRTMYKLPADADWNNVQATVCEDMDHVTLWDPATNQRFLAIY